jgi:drug/metabolite transporter (DMT)-like permease
VVRTFQSLKLSPDEQKQPIGPSHLVLYLTPLYTAGIAWLLLGEPVRWYHALGAALVFPGLILANRGARR